ncbi:MAG: hypothetical protein V9E93_16620 [Steroidobacteraceae bacterium]
MSVGCSAARAQAVSGVAAPTGTVAVAPEPAEDPAGSDGASQPSSEVVWLPAWTATTPGRSRATRPGGRCDTAWPSSRTVAGSCSSSVAPLVAVGSATSRGTRVAAARATWPTVYDPPLVVNVVLGVP